MEELQPLEENLIETNVEDDSHHSKVNTRRAIVDTILITAGVFSASIGLKGFVIPNHFIDGGATGISLLGSIVFPAIPLWAFLIVVNIPFIAAGYKIIGKTFSIKASAAITGLAIVATFIPFPQVTDQPLLIAVFGGFFLGAGIGLAVRGGAVLDGTEVMAIYVNKKTGLTMGDVILMFNIIIFAAGAWVLGIEKAMYSVLTYLAASKTVDFFIQGLEEYTGVTIISGKSEEIRRILTFKMGRGVTVYKGKKGYGKRGEEYDEIEILFTVITRLEVSKLNHEIEKIDPMAFIVMNSIKDTKGGMIKKRSLEE